ncbi:MAG TPA: glutathione S-transferase family protein [Methylomirabilota bacterium]|jgi:glutathione S-transferase|nr:glutathione S-transferase family protein [Methylomirabilota bacterium]
MIKLYDFPQSPYCQKVRLVLAEKDLSFDKVFVDLMKNEQKSPDFLRLNPYGKVPVLVDEGEAVYDSTVINEYLEDEYPHPPLMPADSGERARVRMFEDFADNSFTAQGGLLAAELRKPPEQSDQDRIQRYRTDLIRVLEFLDRQLEGKEYIAGDFSLADLAFVPRLLQLPSLGVEIPARLRNVIAWSERLKQRDSVRQLQQELGLV